jgi:hypothetical protein
MNPDPEAENQFGETFFPYATAAKSRVIAQGGKFVYYTTAATAIQIIQNRQIWMRSTAIMNDFMEVEHGVRCIETAYRSDAGKAFDASLDECFPGLASEVRQLFGAWIPKIRHDTYVTSFSEHPSKEDAYGRLSMWRAYGGSAGVALVLNGGPLLRPSDALGAYSSPVLYGDVPEMIAQFKDVAHRIRTNSDYVRGLGQDQLKGVVFSALRFAAVCTKHNAFSEEQEWRVVASPSLRHSPDLAPQVTTIGAVPQLVLKIPLEDQPEKGLFGLAPAEFIDKILIGPCEHPDAIGRALEHALSAAGVPAAGSRIVATDIPLRANQR